MLDAGTRFFFERGCEHRPGSGFDHRIPAGRHVLTITAAPNIVLPYPSSITVNVRSGGRYVFTALWDSDHVYLRPTTFSPAEMAKMGL
jgi:hypothetical protein